MKFQLVAVVLLVGCMLAPSLAVPLWEGETKAVLQGIRKLLASTNHGIQQSEDATPSPHVTSTQSSPPVTSIQSGKSDKCYQYLQQRIKLFHVTVSAVADLGYLKGGFRFTRITVVD